MRNLTTDTSITLNHGNSYNSYKYQMQGGSLTIRAILVTAPAARKQEVLSGKKPEMPQENLHVSFNS